MGVGADDTVLYIDSRIDTIDLTVIYIPRKLPSSYLIQYTYGKSNVYFTY